MVLPRENRELPKLEEEKGEFRWREIPLCIFIKLRETYPFRPCFHTDSPRIRSCSNTQTKTLTYEYSTYWICAVFSVNTKYGDIWIRRYSLNWNTYTEIGLGASYFPGVVWTLNRIHSVFAFKRSSMNRHCFSSSNTEANKYEAVWTRP